MAERQIIPQAILFSDLTQCPQVLLQHFLMQYQLCLALLPLICDIYIQFASGYLLGKKRAQIVLQRRQLAAHPDGWLQKFMIDRLQLYDAMNSIALAFAAAKSCHAPNHCHTFLPVLLHIHNYYT